MTKSVTTTTAAGKPGAGSQVLLDINAIGISFGGLKAVQDFSLQLPAAGLFGLIGPNGAGKTTIFNLLTGVYAPDRGEIYLASQRLFNRQPHQITAAGIARTFQNIRLFPDLSVLDNVRLAGQLHNQHGLFSTLLRTRGYHREEHMLQEKAFSLLEIFGLQDRAHELASNLSYGHQRKLEIVRALATNPQVLLLDEPAAGLNPQEKKLLAQSIQQIRDRFQVAVLLIEHDMPLVMEICENIIVLDHGVTICRGTPSEVQNDERVIAAYLGSGLTDE